MKTFIKDFLTIILPLWFFIMAGTYYGCFVMGKGNVCPDCGEKDCIYQQIDKVYDQSQGNDLTAAIYKVCKDRGITDSSTIDLVKANYNIE